MYLGIISLSSSLIGGIFIIIVSLVLLVACVCKFREVYLREKEEVNNEK